MAVEELTFNVHKRRAQPWAANDARDLSTTERIGLAHVYHVTLGGEDAGLGHFAYDCGKDARAVRAQ